MYKRRGDITDKHASDDIDEIISQVMHGKTASKPTKKSKNNRFKLQLPKLPKNLGKPAKKILKPSKWHLLFAITLIVIFIGSVTIALVISSKNSIATKKTELIAQVGESNNLLYRIIPVETNSFIKEIDFAINTLETAQNELQNLSTTPAPTLAEKIFQSEMSSQYESKAESTRDLANSYIDRVETLAHNVKLLKKFLQYDASQDLIYAKENKDDALVRIDRAQAAIQEILDDNLLYVEISEPLKASKRAFIIIGIDDVEALDTQLKYQQSGVAKNLQQTIQKLQADFNSSYNDYLYQ